MATAKIAVLYYSLYGHCKVLADAAAKSAAATGAEVSTYQM
jgi:multimeric flavodoxin WrbA